MNTKKIIKDAVCDNFDCKGEILNNIIGNTKKTSRTTHSRPIRLIAVVAAIVLAMTVTVAAVVLNRSVTLSLSTDKDTVIKGDKVYVTATAKNMTDFIDGIYGFTVDVGFDNTRFDFDSDFGVEKANGIGTDFTAIANLSDTNTVTVLFYANITSGTLSFIDKDVQGNTCDVFRLCFTVKDDAIATTDGADFILGDCKVADAASVSEGFELVESVTLEETELNVSALQRGDVNGDEDIDIRDLVAFHNNACEIDGIFFEFTADCDKNGTVDAAVDMVWLRDFLLGIIESF